MIIGIKHRLKLAWKAFNLKEFDIVIEPYHMVAALAYNDEGDSKFCLLDGRDVDEVCTVFACPNSSRECLSRTRAVLRIVQDDHVHVCHRCSRKMVGGVHR